MLATSQTSLLDLPAQFDEIGGGATGKIGQEFGKYGLELVDFFINAITPPEEVQKAIDARSSMGAIGDLQAYTMYQAANSMRKMAEQGGAGGAAAAPMGMGMGAGFGMMLPGMIRNAMQSGARVNPNQFQAGARRRGRRSRWRSSRGRAGGARVSAASRRPLPQPPADPKQLVRSVAQSAGWQCLEAGDAWQIVVPIGSLRKQTVVVRFDQKDPDGHPLVSYSSVCGPSTPENAMQLLKFNAQMVMGAFGVQEHSERRRGRRLRQPTRRHQHRPRRQPHHHRHRLAGGQGGGEAGGRGSELSSGELLGNSQSDRRCA